MLESTTAKAHCRVSFQPIRFAGTDCNVPFCYGHDQKPSPVNSSPFHQLQWVWNRPVGHWLTKLVYGHLSTPPCLICWQNWPCNAQLSALAHGTVDQVQLSCNCSNIFPITFSTNGVWIVSSISWCYDKIHDVVTTCELKAQLMCLRQGWFMH